MAAKAKGTVTQMEYPCWAPIGYGEDAYVPHFDTREQAEADIAQQPEADQLAAAVCDVPCWVAFAACGEAYGAEGFLADHYLDRDTLLAALADSEWRVGDDGSVRCPRYHECDCPPDEENDDD